MSHLVRKILGRSCCRLISKHTCPSTALFSSRAGFRLSDENPANHSSDHVGLFYTVPEATLKTLFALGGLPKSFQMNVRTFSELCLMVRRPALEIIDLMKKSDFSHPAIRYVIYGKPGCGKSITLAHVLHYVSLNEFIILHVPWVWNWFRPNRTEVVYSQNNKEFVDLPLLSAAWLKHFQSQNGELLSKLDIRLSKDYVWNPREKTPAGDHISSLVTHGINRVKYAADCVHALIQEIKMACNEDKCKAFVAIDGFNAFFGENTNLKTEDRTKVKPKQVTLVHAFLEATKQDWHNAAIVVTADQLSGRHQTLESHFPLYLLGKKGFEHLHPFVAVHVPELTDLELHSMLDYYEDRKWLQCKDGRKDLSFLSNNNPYVLMNLCSGL